MQANSLQIPINKIEKSKLNNVDFNNLEFGKQFTDHMLVCNYTNEEWETPHITPYQPITLDPSARVFHYGQAVFEGMKAYKDEKNDIFLFRPEENFNRLNKSCVRLSMPEIPKAFFFEGLEKLLNLDKAWIPSGIGNTLYIRPFMIATQAGVMASPSDSYKFMIICSPAQSYYSKPISVLIAEKYSRSANGGIGFAKAAGNYAAQFYPTTLANQKGFQQIIWTDSATHEYMEEAGTMNVFFRINDTLITAPTSDRILDGITRKSLIKLAEKLNIPIEIRAVKVNEIIKAAKNKELKEVFGSGTAAIVSPIQKISHQGISYDIPILEESYASKFKEVLLNIQYNQVTDEFGWRYAVKKV